MRKDTSKLEKLREKLVKEVNQLYSDVSQRPIISRPSDAAELFIPLLCNLMREEFWVATLDTRYRVISVQRLYVGTLNRTSVRVAEVFRPAIADNACALLVAHNHPSGDPTPSLEDTHLTRSLYQAGKLLELELVDHIIISPAHFCKFHLMSAPGATPGR
jgi:DNA repair protein RadC